jgi:hypothetical protein
MTSQTTMNDGPARIATSDAPSAWNGDYDKIAHS